MMLLSISAGPERFSRTPLNLGSSSTPDTTVNALPSGITMPSLDRSEFEGPAHASDRVNHAEAVMDGLRALIPSEWPALVFTSLAALSVPLFSDRCQIFIEEDGLSTYRIERPVTATPVTGDEHHKRNRVRDSWSGQWVSDHAVQTSFSEPASATADGFRGTVLHLWNPDYELTGTDLALAQLLVEHAIDLLRQERGQADAGERGEATGAGVAVRSPTRDLPTRN